MKKNLSFALMTILSLALFVACGEGNQQSTQQPASPAQGNVGGGSVATTDTRPEPVTLSILMGRDTVMEPFYAAFALLYERYNISMDIDIRPGGPEGEHIVRTRLATGDMTDIVPFNSGALFFALNPPQHFVDISDQPFVQNLDYAFLSTVTVGNQVFGVPLEDNLVGGIYYNIRIYEELGLSVPRTWNDFMNNLQVIQDAGYTPMAGAYADIWTTQLVLLSDFFYLHSAQPTWYQDFTYNRAGFANTPLALRSFEKTYDLARFMNADAIATRFPMAVEMLATGEAAHFPMHSFLLSIIASDFPEYVSDIGFFALPGDDPNHYGITVWLSDAIFIYNQTPNLEAAMTFMNFMASPEIVELRHSIRPPIGPSSVLGVELPPDSMRAVLDAAVYFEHGLTAPGLEFISPLKGPNLPQITQELGLGMSNPQRAAELFDADNERQAIQLGLDGW